MHLLEELRRSIGVPKYKVMFTLQFLFMWHYYLLLDRVLI